jgi:transposase-like protein
MANRRRTFTPEFEAESVRGIAGDGKSLAEVARGSVLAEHLRLGWIQTLAPRDARTSPARRGHPPDVETVFHRLVALVVAIKAVLGDTKASHDSPRIHAERLFQKGDRL